MDLRWQPVEQDSKRTASVWLHPSATPLQMIQESHTDGYDLTPFVTQCSHSKSEATVSLAWHDEFYQAGQPRPDMIIELRLDNQLLWWGQIEAINDYRLSSGERSAKITARSRDASPFWRDIRRATPLYPVTTPLTLIAREILASLGLESEEIDLPEVPLYTVHSNTQLADLTAWGMLEALFEPAGADPFISARGIVKPISRDLMRDADIYLSTDRVKSVSGSRSRPPINLVRVKWLDPNFTKVYQQDRLLANKTITGGYFQPVQKKTVHFSEDGTQRAENTYMVIKQSAKGLVPVCTEKYKQLTIDSGQITLQSWAYTASLVIFIWQLDDPTKSYWEFKMWLVMILLIMISVGTGHYEIWGTPYDFVHARNRTEAYNDQAPEWLINEVEIENDFVMDETMAQAYAIRELIYRSRSASSFDITIVDDPRIEPGDIIQLEDGSRIYVTDYRRDLSPGASALLELSGFRV